jgi:hypothetical protein
MERLTGDFFFVPLSYVGGEPPVPAARKRGHKNPEKYLVVISFSYPQKVLQDWLCRVDKAA